MLGTFKLALAILVAYSHSGVDQEPLWFGVVAVVIFYMISGYAMTGLLTSRFQKASALSFFAERFVRLAPQYYFWLAATTIVAFGTPWLSPNSVATLLTDALFYIAVFPMGLQFYGHNVGLVLIPQATSLGIEITFYILSPWILRSRTCSYIAFVICLSIFTATAFDVLPANIRTYYSSPGPMAFYLIGSFIYRRDWTSATLATAAMLAVLGLNYDRTFEREFLVGLCVGVAALLWLPRLRQRTWDTALGNASYGCFLCHTVVFTIFLGALDVEGFGAILRTAAISTSVLLGYFSYRFLEFPTVRFRRSIGEPQKDKQLSAVM